MSDTQESTPWINHFHFIIPNATGAAILLLPSPDGWRLPYVRTQDIWLSSTGRISDLLREAYPLDFPFTILRYIAIDADEKQRWDRILFLLEPGQPLEEPPLDGQWFDLAALKGASLALPEQRSPLLHHLQEREAGDRSPAIDPRRAPWARSGWFAAAAAWIEEAIIELGYTQSGPVEQLRNWSISSLLVAPTTAGRVYFKVAASLPLFVNEPALMQALSELYPQHLPVLLKIDRARCWMLMEDFGSVAREDKDIGYDKIFSTYGRLQRDSARHLDQLLAASCIDRRLDVLATQIDPLIADPNTRAVLTSQEYEELVALVPYLKERCIALAQYNIPATLIHGDLHMGNVTERNGEIIFFDWTDAAVSHPFFDHFLLYFELDKDEGVDRSRDAYLQAWHDCESPARLLEAWELAKPLCALHHAVSYASIANNIEPLTRDELLHGLTDSLRRILASFKAN